MWQKVQELAPSRHPHNHEFLQRHIGPHVGQLTLRTLADKVLGTIPLAGQTPAELVFRPDGLGHSGSEVYSLAFYDEPSVATGTAELPAEAI